MNEVKIIKNVIISKKKEFKWFVKVKKLLKINIINANLGITSKNKTNKFGKP